jgi:hypothetical protein
MSSCDHQYELDRRLIFDVQGNRTAVIMGVRQNELADVRQLVVADNPLDSSVRITQSENLMI